MSFLIFVDLIARQASGKSAKIPGKSMFRRLRVYFRIITYSNPLYWKGNVTDERASN